MKPMHAFFSPECVLVRPAAENKEDVLRALVEALTAAGRAGDAEQLLRDVQERESLASTALGFGCAVPHVHSETVARTAMAAAILEKPIDFGADDGEPVSLVIMMAGPAERARTHLKILSRLARFLHTEDFRQQLMAAENAEQFIGLLREKEG